MENQELHRISDRIWYLDPTAETDRPALGYIRGDRFSIMVDAGNSPAHVDLFYSRLKENGLPLPSLCLITHWHWDHTFGIPGLGIPSACTAETARCLRDNAGRADEIYASDGCVRAEYGSPSDIDIRVPDLTFSGRFSVDAGGVETDLVYVGGPHSSDSAIVYIPQENFIFGGDSSSGNFSLPGIAYDIPLLDEHERLLRTFDFDLYLHSHRPLMTRDEFFAFLDAGRKRGFYTFD